MVLIFENNSLIISTFNKTLYELLNAKRWKTTLLDAFRKHHTCINEFWEIPFCAQESSSRDSCVGSVISSTSVRSICDGESATLTATYDGRGCWWFDAEVGVHYGG